MCHYDSLLSTVHWIPFSLTDFHQSVAFFAFYFLCKFARCYLLHGGLHTSVKLAFGTSLQKIFIWHYLEVSCFNVNWTLVILGESICVLLQKTLLLMYTKAVSLPMTWYRHYIIIHSMQAEQAWLLPSFKKTCQQKVAWWEVAREAGVNKGVSIHTYMLQPHTQADLVFSFTSLQHK